jgi:hypothetical protein
MICQATIELLAKRHLEVQRRRNSSLVTEQTDDFKDTAETVTNYVLFTVEGACTAEAHVAECCSVELTDIVIQLSTVFPLMAASAESAI